MVTFLNSVLENSLKDFNEVGHNAAKLHSEKRGAKSGIEYSGLMNPTGLVLEAKAAKTGSSISYDLPFSVFLRVNDPAALIHYTLLDLKDRLVQHVFGLAPRGNTLH